MDYFILIYDTLSLSSRLQKKCKEKRTEAWLFSTIRDHKRPASDGYNTGEPWGTLGNAVVST